MSRNGGASVLSKLRAVMTNIQYTKEEIKAYFIPANDAHSNRMVSACDDRKGFITGFYGGYGVCLVTENKAGLWTDGRYYRKALGMVDKDQWEVYMLTDPSHIPPSRWISQIMPQNSKIGMDPKLVSYSHWMKLSNNISALRRDLSLIPIKQNLVDLIWEDRPSRPNHLIEPHPRKFSGKKIKQKLIEIRRMMRKKKATILVVDALDEIAWLLNLRGSDLAYNPLFYAYVFVEERGFILFTDGQKITSKVRYHIEEELPYKYYIEMYDIVIENLRQKSVITDGLVWCPKNVSYELVSVIPQEKLLLQPSPISIAKLTKTHNEIVGMREANLRDGAAMCCFLHWLQKNVALEKKITEYDAIEELENYRLMQDHYAGPSFPTTSAYGDHSCIKHYYISEKEKGPTLGTDNLYMVDAGAHYLDGTTSCTRTLHFGEPTPKQKELFTRILKGLIALSTLKFPNRRKGIALDIFARKALWDVGKDYFHRTGHSIGAYLSSHEGPMYISKLDNPFDPGFNPRMFLTCNPTCCHKKEFGVHIENTLLSIILESPYQFEQVYLGFETVTFVPFQRRLIALELLDPEELQWLNNYHAAVLKKIAPLLEKLHQKETIKWLIETTEPLKLA